MILYLLRHGQGEANLKNLVTGSQEDPLTPLGRRQAERAGQSLGPLGGRPCFSSPWRRARETAALARPKADFFYDERLGETWAGDAAEMTRAEFETLYPDFFRSFNPGAAFPGGESHRDLNARVLDWLRETAAKSRPEEKVLAVTHMGPISCILQYIFEIPMSMFPRFRPGHGTFAGLAVPPSAAAKGCALLFFAALDCDHDCGKDGLK